MEFLSMLSMASGLAVAVERSMEVVKIAYLKLKKFLFPKKNYTELTRDEKIVLTVIVSVSSVFIGGKSVILPIPGVMSLPLPVQSIITGLIICIGSNVLHTVYSMLSSIKNNIESAKNTMITFNNNSNL